MLTGNVGEWSEIYTLLKLLSDGVLTPGDENIEKIKGFLQALIEKGWTEIVLEARENAVPFYEAIGYTIVAESYLLFSEIQHYRMQKSL